MTVRHRPGLPLEAYTSVPEAGWDGVVPSFAFGNERPYVEALVAMYPEIRPHWIEAAGLFFEHKMEAMFALSGLPAGATGNLQWYHEAMGQARASGCDVFLGGNMGNVTFSFDGTDSLAAMLRRGRWLSLWKDAGIISRGRGVSRFRVLVSQAILPHAPGWLYEKLGRLGLIKIDDPYATWCPLNRDYAATMQVEEQAKLMGYDFHPRSKASSRHWRDMNITAAEVENADSRQALELLHDIEFRDPTNYRPLLEFCLGIPDEQYAKDGVTRRLARRILKGLVPDAVLDEDRMGLQVADWHLRLGRQREDLIAEIDRLAQDSRMAEMLNLAEFRRLLTDWRDPYRPEDVSMVRYGMIRSITMARYIRFVKGQNG